MPRKYVFTLIVTDDYLEEGQTVEKDLENFHNKSVMPTDWLGVAEDDPNCSVTMTVEDLK